MGIVQLRGAWLAATLAALPAAGQEAAVRGEKIEVTGSNIKRVEAETALPVTVITRDEIRRSGATTAEEILEKLSANVGGYNTPTGVGDGTTPGLSAVSLRGLGPNSTLVLMNGRRLSNFAFNGTARSTVNLNQVPLVAVERIEVLKDGASAVYGTDAIAGVVNFILRKDYAGAEATAYATSTQRGGGQAHRYTATAGFGDLERSRFNVLAALDWQKNAALKAEQRPSFAGSAIRPDLGVALTSQNVHPANFAIPGRPGTFNATAGAGCVPELRAYRVTAAGAPSTAVNVCRYDFTSVLDIYPPAERKGVFLRGAYAISRDHHAFAEYHLARNEVTFVASETPVSDFIGLGGIFYPANGPYYPTSFTTPAGVVIRPSGALRINWRLRDGGLRTNLAETEEDRLVAGMQGALAGWDYNAAFSNATSRATEAYLDGFVSDSALRRAIGTGLIDVFSGRPQTAEALALIAATKITGKVRESDASVRAMDARASRELLETRHGSLSMALGIERREEAMEERPEPILFSGDILGAGGVLPPTTRATREVTSLFAEMALPLARNVEAQIALRRDRFSDFGNTANPKAALRWTPSAAWLARASFGTGFRAPTLTDLFLPQTTGLAFESDPARCPGGEPIGDFVALEECSELPVRVGGNPAAQPEKSRQWTFGVLWEPRAGNSLGIDFWRIHRRDSLEVLPFGAVLAFGEEDPISARGRFVRNPRLASGGCAGDGEFPTPAGAPCPLAYAVNVIENLGNHNVSGMDVSATARATVAGGQATMRLEGTYYASYRYQVERGDEYREAAGRASGIGGLPRWRHYAQVAWRRGTLEAVLAHSFVHGYLDERLPSPINGELPPARRVASWESWDVQATWRAWRGLEIVGGVRNVFDRDPPASRQGNTFQVGYDARYFDPRGRTYHLALRYSL